MASPDPLLEGRRLTLRRGDRTLFDALDLAVRPGEFWVVRGDSGAGKTSLLRCLTGELRPQQGTVTRRAPVAEIPQGLALSGHLSPWENVCAGRLDRYPGWRTALGFPRRDREEALALLRELGIDAADRPTHRFSGGERQRMAVARALFQERPLIVADEPVSMLQPVLARRTLALLRERARLRGGAVLCALHAPDLIDEFATHRVEMP